MFILSKFAAEDLQELDCKITCLIQALLLIKFFDQNIDLTPCGWPVYNQPRNYKLFGR